MVERCSWLGATVSLSFLVGSLSVACGSTNEPTSRQKNGHDGENQSLGGTSGNLGGSANTSGDSKSQPCEFGDDQKKCNGKADVACAPILRTTNVACSTDNDCFRGELCFETAAQSTSQGACRTVAGACLPRCGGNFDCDASQYCNVQSGQCQAEPHRGRRFGESCTLQEGTCAGDCVDLGDGNAECEEHCRVGSESGCGQMEFGGSGVACAFFAYDLADISKTQGAGDVGICAHLCDCTGDCPTGQSCLARPNAGYAGVCAGGIAQEATTRCQDNMGGAEGASAP